MKAVFWTIVDRRDNRPVTINCYITEQSATDQITEWQNRHERGGRPDVSRESLLNMQPRLVSEALPWGSPRAVPDSPVGSDAAEQGRVLASQREDLIARGVNPADLLVPLYPESSDLGSTGGEL